MNPRRFWGTALGLVALISVLLPLGPANRGLRPLRDPAVASLQSPFALARLALVQPALVQPALAGPVDWREVEATPEGRQWWDAGSLRRDRRGQLSVLSRFQPAAPPPEEPSPAAAATQAASAAPAAQSPADSPARLEPRPQLGTLYVMELDCDQELYRDVSVNGIPRWGAPWQPAAGESLTMATLRAACAAAPPPQA
jgi:hypothetical protein